MLSFIYLFTGEADFEPIRLQTKVLHTAIWERQRLRTIHSSVKMAFTRTFADDI